MSEGERFSTLKTLAVNYKPATRENLLQFCKACDNLTESLIASLKCYQACSELVTSEYLFYMYRQLRENIWRFVCVNMDMVACQYVSIYADHQEEMNIHLSTLNEAILKFQELPINRTPDAVQQLMCDNDVFGFFSDSSSDEENYRLSSFINKVLPGDIRFVNEQLELLLMKNQQLYAICRGHRTGKELGYIYRNCNDRYMTDEFPQKRKEEEACITKSMRDTGKSRYDVLQGRYDKRSSELMNSRLGCIAYGYHDDEEGMATEMTRLGMEKECFDNLFRDTNLTDYLGGEIQNLNTDNHNLWDMEDEEEENADTLIFKSSEMERLIDIHKNLVDDYMTSIGAKQIDWVCVYQIVMFYMLEKKVSFVVFCKWLNGIYGRTIISESYARGQNNNYFVQNAGKQWNKKNALTSKNTSQMEKKLWFYMTHIPKIYDLILLGKTDKD